MTTREEKVIQFNLKDNRYKLTRISDKTYLRLAKKSLPIADDGWFLMKLYRDEDAMNLAQIYVALEELTGESGTLYDDWKGSFAFPFTIEIDRGGRLFQYLMRVHDFRGTPDFSIRKVLPPDHVYDKKDRFYMSVIREPFPDEFSREDINGMIAFFCGLLEGYFETRKESFRRFFFKCCQSNHIIFGFDEGAYFENQYDTEEDYEAAVERFEEKEERSSAVRVAK